jgi:preprotein translocase subunit YajC
MLIIWVVVFIAIFYFMAIRPQQKQRKAHMDLLSSLKRGDTIVTASGMYGKVAKVEDNRVEVEISKGVIVKIDRRAVSQIIRDKDEAKALAPARGGRKSAPAEIEEVVEDAPEASTEEAVDETYAETDESVEGEDSQQR